MVKLLSHLRFFAFICGRLPPGRRTAEAV